MAFTFFLNRVDFLTIFAALDTAKSSNLHFFIVLDELDHIVHDSLQFLVLAFHTSDLLLDKGLMLFNLRQRALMRVINSLPELFKRVLVPHT